MKKVLVLPCIICLQLVSAQNVGIGITTPTTTLDVIRGTAPAGTARFRGTTYSSLFKHDVNEDTYIRAGKDNSNVILNDIPGGKVGIGLPHITISLFPTATLDVARGTAPGGTAQFRGTQYLSHFNYSTSENTFIRGGKDSSSVIINDIPGGKVGIGAVPTATLDVIRGTGINGTALFRGTQHTSHFNYATYEDTYIRGGKDSSSVIINDIPLGRVGIGINDPSFILDVGNRMRIRSGANSAGIFLNNSSNSPIIPAFIGMENDTHVGFYGDGAGWKFAMNTQTGALKINGSQGASKQVLQSRGPDSSASWKTLGSIVETYYNYPSGFYHAEGTLAPGGVVVLTALTRTVTIQTKSRFIISAVVYGDRFSCVGCDPITVNIDIRINGAEIVPGVTGISLLNAPAAAGSFGRATATISNFFYDANPGTYTIEFIVQGSSGGNIQVASKYSTILVLPID